MCLEWVIDPVGDLPPGMAFEIAAHREWLSLLRVVWGEGKSPLRVSLGVGEKRILVYLYESLIPLPVGE
ncbi:MAG TPA: hypothetical protein VK638_08600, partial [Edaphobacter sp.]|nr:hypothetical protein [Edaphobacter sp.]